MRQVKTFLKKVYEIIKRPEMRILPGQLAFFIVVSLIPLIALVATIASKLGLSMEVLSDVLAGAVPSSVIDLLASITMTEDLNFNIIIFFIAGFLLASNGLYSIINTSNQIYRIDQKSEISRRLKAIVMTVILVLLLLFIVIMPILGDLILNMITSNIANQQVINIINNIYRICSYPIMLFLIYFNIKLLYTMAPDTRIDHHSVVPGAVFTTIMWFLSSKIYAFYVEYFSNYNQFYGSISNLLVLLMWVYIISYIFTLGISFNSTGIITETIEMKKIRTTKNNNT